MSRMINNQFDPGFTVSILLVRLTPMPQRTDVCDLSKQPAEEWRKPVAPEDDFERWDGLS